MEFLKHFDWSFKSIAKIFGIFALGIVAITVVIALLSFSIKTIFNTSTYKDGYNNYSYDYMDEAESFGSTRALNAKMAMPSPIIPESEYSTGNDAENYEVKEYNGSIKTRKLDKTCEIISKLKTKEYVIFENSDKNKESCNYRFKVEKEKGNEIVETIKSLKPETFNASIDSIKKAIEGYDNELDILKKKLESIESTLAEAQNSYDAISKIATRQNDAETLAKIIDSKLKLIEKLTNERLNTKERIDKYNNIKADQLDRLKYTFFNISVYKDLIFDWKEIKDSWKYEVKQLIRNVNEVFQAITLRLVTYIVRVSQVIIYLFLSLFLLKFVWIGTKYAWRGGKKKE